MKIIPTMKIESCYDCPYCRHNPISNGYNCTNERMPDEKMTFIISDKKLVETKENWPEIPSWCPLENARKKVKILEKEKEVKISEKETTALVKKPPCLFKTKNRSGNLCNRNHYKSLCSLNVNCEFKD